MQLNESELSYWLALWRMENIGPVHFFKILEKYRSPQEYFHAHTELLKNIDWPSIENDLRWAAQSNHHIITFQDKIYPNQLKEIHSAPPLLFAVGNPHLLECPQISMVGSRNPTAGGCDNAYQFAKIFAQAGFIITSGLAMGIDAACHQGALESASGKTIAVMATGPDIIYPKRHNALSKNIIENGCLITEFPTGVKPQAAHFPRRNRLISGLSLGVLVVEAAFASGSLITAKYALEQNKEIFAIPGSIQNPLSRGCHALIKQGAKLVETAQDILDEMTIQPNLNAPNPRAPIKYIQKPVETPEFLAFIDFETTSIDTIIDRSALTAEKVSSILLLLELEGHIVSTPGGYVRLH